MHNVWTNHRETITNRVVIQRIECYSYARQLLTTMGPERNPSRRDGSHRRGPPIDRNELSDLNLIHLDRNAQRIEKVIKEIEEKQIPALGSRYLEHSGRTAVGLEAEHDVMAVEALAKERLSRIFGGVDAHPSTLTQTERLRVIRACYQIWDLTRRDDDEAKAGVSRLRPRESPNSSNGHATSNFLPMTSGRRSRSRKAQGKPCTGYIGDNTIGVRHPNCVTRGVTIILWTCLPSGITGKKIRGI
jgi:hypothetical protein